MGRLDRPLRFLAVGGVAFVVDVGLFNLLVHGPSGILHDRPLSAKVLATALSTVVSFGGNKLWTYVVHERVAPLRQTAVFVLVNLIAWGLALVPLIFSRYVLGLDSAVADNVSGNFVGVGVALIFRFWAYGRYVFPTGSSPTSVMSDRQS